MPSGGKDRSLIAHGADTLSHVNVRSYNVDVRSGSEILNTHIRRGAFDDLLRTAREELRKSDADPFGDAPLEGLGRKGIAEAIAADKEADALLAGVIETFARSFAEVVLAFLKQKSWRDIERIAVGGGFSRGDIGERTIARTATLIKAEGHRIDMIPIKHHPDEAGLIGATQLIPSWMLKGHDAMLAVDIGGTNFRAGIVETRLDQAPDLAKARVHASELWRHADDGPQRTEAIETLADMLKAMIRKAEKDRLDLAPVIGIGCPGVIDADGRIERGALNLPGNWESERFNLPREIAKRIPRIGPHDTFVIMHNDAVVQGLSQRPFMSDVAHWGIFTIGTGLGNASFDNIGDEPDE